MLRAERAIRYGIAHRRAERGWLQKRDPCERSEQSDIARAATEQIVRLFTNALEWRCLDRIRAPIQELCVTNLPE
jgi:hypothetical protein